MARKAKKKTVKAKKRKVAKKKTRTAKAASARRKVRKAAKRKTPARKAKAKTKAKAAKAKPRKTAKKARRTAKKKEIYGEGNYTASRKFLKDEANFVTRNRAKIPGLGKDAEAALDGSEGAGLREAEAEAASHAHLFGDDV